MQTMVPLYGFGGGSYAAIRKTAPRNLLDNSDFRNPVNQRGQASYSGSYVFCVDRWCVSSDAAVTDSGLTCSGGNFLLQRMQLKNLPIGRYTGAVCTADGTIVCGSVDFTASGSPEMIASENGIVMFLQKVTSDLVQFVLNSGDQKTWVWAALYAGEYTAATLPEYRCKGYGAELAECQRYYQQFVSDAFLGSGIVGSDGVTLQGFIPLHNAMRITPTIIGSLAFFDGTQTQTLDALQTFTLQGNGIRCTWVLKAAAAAKSVGFISAVGMAAFSADL